MDFQELLDNLRDFLEENRKMAVIVCSGLCLLMMLMLIAVCIQNSSKKKLSVHEEKKLVLDQPLLIPDGPTVPKGYITSRKTEKTGLIIRLRNGSPFLMPAKLKNLAKQMTE